MTASQRKLLRRSKSGIHYDAMAQAERDTLRYLTEQDFVKSRCDVGGDGFFLITEDGKRELSDMRKKLIRQVATAVAGAVTLAATLIEVIARIC